MTNHPERRPTRLTNYDYSLAGAYFVTINAYERERIFGEVVDGVMRLNDMGEIVRDAWMAIPGHFEDVEIDEFVVMPNHFHGIVFIFDQNLDVGMSDLDTNNPGVGATHASPLPKARGPKRRSLGSIVGSFKAAATRRINQHRNHPGLPVWQRNYHDRIIRNDRQLDAIRQYILNNPQNWHDDENHPDRQS